MQCCRHSDLVLQLFNDRTYHTQWALMFIFMMTVMVMMMIINIITMISIKWGLFIIVIVMFFRSYENKSSVEGRVKLPPRLLLIVALSAFASPSIHLQSSSIELSSLLRLKCLRYLPEPVPDHLLLCFFAFIQTSVVLAGFGLLIKTGPD